MGKDNNAIYSDNSYNGTDLKIDAAATTGGENGIRGTNEDNGAWSITKSGVVTGSTGYGITTETEVEKITKIILSDRSGILDFAWGDFIAVTKFNGGDYALHLPKFSGSLGRVNGNIVKIGRL